MTVDHQVLAERYAAALMAGGDLAVIDELFTEDYVDEYPQSGEIIRGRHNLKALMAHRPGRLSDSGADLATIRARATD
jgi:SnoaL-like protein